MFLSKVFVNNFRSISNLEVILQKGRNVIVGKNNSGKSNIIKAINVVLGEKSPLYNSANSVSLKDFYCSQGENEPINRESKMLIACFLKMDDDEQIDFDAISASCNGFYKMNQSRIVNNLSNLYELFETDADDLDRSDKTYISSNLRNQVPIKTEFKNINEFGLVFMAENHENDDLSKSFRLIYRKNGQSEWAVAFTAYIRTQLIQSAIIPSFRDPQNELRLNEWSWYGKLMKHLVDTTSKRAELITKMQEIKTIGDEVFQEIKSNIETDTFSLVFQDAKIHFQFNQDQKDDLYKNCSIHIDDGIKTPISEKGSGIQSATIIELFNYYIKEINTQGAALLGVEEPELYLHPHARRVVSDRLDDFCDHGKNQVIITTHNAEFIKSSDAGLNIIVASKTNGKTEAKTLNMRNLQSLLLDDRYREIFFADKIIICEGFDEYIIKFIDREKFNNGLNTKNVSTISVGGKDNFSNVYKLIKQLGMPCYLFADFDYLLRDKTEDADEFETENGSKRHESIENMTISYFEQDYIFGSNGSKYFSEMQKLRSEIKSKHKELFYQSSSIEEFSDPFKKQISDLLSFFRGAGICILGCQIEKLWKDSGFHDKKFDQSEVFKLNSRIINGEKISDILDSKEVEDFLKVILI